ncbi:GCN5 family acetyltransferase [Sphingomonas sp. Leaf339]|uniref:GNAT family N-acetyltransferase n=1 Tax=Sphingomonas sp. Leaf339 TaxID=1736343 RepID=UPI0006F20092|nr:N-acetyltransferase [Sphingomonas sp. Leaf339]KQU55824.1 GCN5 family acetyltransferase [Sphingomonas sp. Leaf339]
MIAIVPLLAEHEAEVEHLLDRAFGPERHGRTAYAVRGAGKAIAGLSFVAIDDGTIVGSIQCWPIVLTTDAEEAVPLVMVGPVAVSPDRQQSGLGRRLTESALAAASANGLDGALMLVGDPEYYGRFFGFTADHTSRWRLPGPVERHRLLARGDAVPDLAGMLGPAVGIPIA